MNGAEQLIRTLVAGGIKVCFANPGTSEMHFCAALDRVEGLECVLGLFEGVVTGAADRVLVASACFGTCSCFAVPLSLSLGLGFGSGIVVRHGDV